MGADDRPHRGRTASDSPFVQVTKARSVKVKLDRKVLYELDGGDRTKVKAFEVEVEPGAVSVCVPDGSATFGFRRTGKTVSIDKRGTS